MPRTLIGTRTVVASPTFGSHLTFDGTSQRAARSTDTSIIVDNFTMACFINLTNTPSATARPFSNGNTGSNGYCFQVSTANLLQVGYNFVVTSSSGQTLTNGIWYHLALVRKSGTSQIYVNGAAAGSTFTNTPNPPNAFISVGCSVNGGTAGSFFPGAVDDCRIYERALAVQEIQDLAHMLPVSSAKLKVWYKLDEGSGTTTADSSGSSFTLTLTNTPTWTTPGHTQTAGPVVIYTARTLAGSRTVIT